MTLKEFYDTVRDDYSSYLDHYRVKRDNSGKKYINVPIMSKEAILDAIESDIDDVLEDIDDFTEEEDKRLMNQVKMDVLNEYDNVLKARKIFMENMYPGEEYEEIYTE